MRRLILSINISTTFSAVSILWGETLSWLLMGVKKLTVCVISSIKVYLLSDKKWLKYGGCYGSYRVIFSCTLFEMQFAMKSFLVFFFLILVGTPAWLKIKISSACAFLLHICSSISFVYAANFTSQFALISTPVPHFPARVWFEYAVMVTSHDVISCILKYTILALIIFGEN